MYTIGDAFIRIKNGVAARRKKIALPKSKVIASLLAVLKSAGFIESFAEEAVEGRMMIIAVPAAVGRTARLSNIHVISTPSLRVYASYEELPSYQKKYLGDVVVSTNKGMMMGKEAHAAKLGGEVLAAIW
jgi:small subunit ribosomal protein S8